MNVVNCTESLRNFTVSGFFKCNDRLDCSIWGSWKFDKIFRKATNFCAKALCNTYLLTDFPTANVFERLRKEFPVAKRHKAIAILFLIGITSRNRVSCFSSLFLTKVTISINVSGILWKSLPKIAVLWQDHFCGSTYVETIVILGKRFKPLFQISNQWSIIQYLNFVSEKTIFLSNFNLLHYSVFFLLQISLPFSLRLAVHIQVVKILSFTLKLVFFCFFTTYYFRIWY